MTDRVRISYADLEQIRGLKSRYFRYVDTKAWDRLPELYTADARFDGFAFDCSTPAVFTTNVAAFLDGVQTVHQGFMPEFAEVGDDRVRGIWSMQDYLRWEPDSRPYRGMTIPGLCGIRGYGHYEEEYRWVGDRWLIDFQRLSRLMVDPVIAGAEPATAGDYARLLDDWLRVRRLPDATGRCVGGVLHPPRG